ncbi:hypothetical protein [Sphingomonas sp. RS2018]
MRTALLAALALAGCTAAADRGSRVDTETEMAEALEGRTAGKPQDCIALPATAGPRIVGESLLYQAEGRLFRNDPVDGCAALRGDPIVVIELFGSRVCRNDRFRTLPRQTSIPGPYCRLGPFVPYDRPR